jgi:hypothetical protein
VVSARISIRLGFVAISLMLPTAPVAAQASLGWYYSVTPYFWAADLDGNVRVDDLAASVNLGSRTVLDNLRFAGAVYGEARVKSYVMGLDATYRSLDDARTIAVPGVIGSFRLDTKQTMVQPSVGYTTGGDSWSVDFLGGMRYWNLDATLGVDQSVAIAVLNDQRASRSWVDAVVGVRLNMAPTSFLRINAGGDGGGGGSHNTWQAYGSIGLDVARWCTLNVSYRGLSVDYSRSQFLYDVRMRGVSYAAMFRFFGR